MSKHGSKVLKSTRSKKPLFQNRVLCSEVKQMVLNKVKICVSNGVKVGNQQYSIIVGPNSVMKLVENNNAAVIVICRDSDAVLHNHLIEAARIRHIPVVILPSCAQQLGHMLNVKRISCFALKQPTGNSTHNTTTINPPLVGQEEGDGTDEMRMEVSIDDLRDTLLQQYKEHSSI